MYPRNAVSPPRISVGAVVQISDGAVQTAGVSIVVRPEGGAETAGAGTLSYGATSGVVYYTPTQAETDYTAFVVVAYKTGCIPAEKAVVTSASSTAGHAGTDQSKITNTTSTVNLSNTTIKTATDIETDTQDIQNRLPAALVDGRIVAQAQSVTDKSGYSLTVTPPTASDIADAVLSESVDDHDGVAHSLAKYISIIKKANTVIDGEVTNAAIPTTTTFTSNVAYPTGAFKHAVLLWLTGSLAEQNSPILTYNNTNGAIVVEEAFTQAPSVGDQFIIIPSTHVHSVAAIAQGVWQNAGRTLSSFDFQVIVGGYAAGQAPLQSLGVNAPAGWINAGAITTDAITNEKIAASAVTKISTGVSNLEVLTRLASMIESDGAGQFRFDTIAVSLAVGGGAGGAVNITVEDRSITVT